MQRTITCLAAASVVALAATAAHAAPTLRVLDSYAANAWTPPAACNAGNLPPPPSAACVPAITTIAGPPAGYRLVRTNTAPTGTGFTRASSFDNGVLTAGVEQGGAGDIRATARFRETYVFTGPTTSAFIVPFNIDRFRAGVNSAGATDIRRAWMEINIGVNSVTRADLDWRLRTQLDGNFANDFALTPAPTPVAGVTLPPGFLAFAGVTVPDTSARLFGPGGPMLVDLGAFTTGQTFTLRYRMTCRVRGTGSGSSFCLVGDPFSVPSGPGFDLGGLAVPAVVPAPAGLALFGLGLVALARLRRR